MKKLAFLILPFLFALPSPNLSAEEIKLASWNIRNISDASRSDAELGIISLSEQAHQELNSNKSVSSLLNEYFFEAANLRIANPQLALEIYQTAKKANPDINLKYQDITVIEKCVEAGDFNADKFLQKFNLADEHDEITSSGSNYYYVWELAEDASNSDRFGKPDNRLVLHLVCRGGFVPGFENKHAVEFAYEQFKKNKISDFDICNHTMSTPGVNFCASRSKEEENKQRKKDLSGILAQFSSENKDKLYAAYDAASAFIEKKAFKEEGHGGTGRFVWALGSISSQKTAYIEQIRKILSKNKPDNKYDFKEADRRLNSLYKQLIEKSKVNSLRYGDGDITTEDLRSVQRLWIKHRDASSKLFHTLNPEVPLDTWKAHFTEWRLSWFKNLEKWDE